MNLSKRHALNCVGALLLVVYALAWPAAALAEELTFCSNVGKYCRGSVNANCCGADLSSPATGANLADTAVDGSVTTDTTGGTLYGCQYTGETAPTEAQIKVGSAPCVSSKTKASPSAGVVDFNTAGSNRFDGLTASTTYRAAYLQDDGTQRPLKELVTTASYSTLAGGGAGGTDLTGLVYVVDSVNGNDSNTGLSVAQAWKTIAKVNSSVTSAGSDVCLMDDSVWTNEKLTADWGGSVSDLGRIMGCYVDTGDSNKLVRYSTGTTTGRGTIPMIVGPLTDACITARNCSYADKSQSNGNSGAAHIIANYMGFYDFQVERVVGVGMMALNVTGVVFDGVKVFKVGGGQMIRVQGSFDFVVKGAEFSRKSLCWIQGVRENGYAAGSSQLLSMCDYAQWGAALLSVNSERGLIENNFGYDLFGEGININQDSRYVLARGNRVGRTHSGAFYFDRCIDCRMDGNISWGARVSVTDYAAGHFGGGIDMHTEQSFSSNVNTIVSNHISVDSSGGCLSANQFPGATNQSTEMNAYGITCVYPASTTVKFNRDVDQTDVFSNVLYNPNLAASSECVLQNSPTTPIAGDFDYNYWQEAPSQSKCKGSNDIYGGDMALPTDSTDWITMNETNVPTFADFRPGASSVLCGAGDPTLETALTGLDLADFGTFITAAGVAEYPWPMDTSAKWENVIEKQLFYYADGEARSATAPDIGALSCAP